MKALFKSVTTKFFLALVLFTTGSMYVFAQDSGGSSSTSVTTTHTESQTWYAQPWVWVVGAALFIIILVALLRGNTTERVSVTKTERTEV